MATEHKLNVHFRLKRRWLLVSYAHAAACFGASDCPEWVIRLAGCQYRIGGGKWVSI